MTDEEQRGAATELGPARLFVGLAQGMMLLALHGADEAHVWPATEHWLFVSLSWVTVFVPLTVLAGLGGLRSTTLGLWTIVATAVVAGVASHRSATDPAMQIARDQIRSPMLAG